MSELIPVPKQYGYVAAFLTLGCNFKCTYCINRPSGELHPRGLLTAAQWTGYLNKLDLPPDLPISFQGGEPSTHPEFYEIIQGLRADLSIDLLTNLSFDVEEFAERIPASRWLRSSPYASIRVTYHPGQSDLEKTLDKIVYLQKRGYPIGLYSIRAPGHEKLIENVAQRARDLGIDYRTKEYLGFSRGKVWGTYHYEGGVFAKQNSTRECRTSELLMAPDGSVFRCHRDLYLNEHPIGQIAHAENHFVPNYVFRTCDKFGSCNPCDLKKKTNRFQVDGHASVEIRFPQVQPLAEMSL